MSNAETQWEKVGEFCHHTIYQAAVDDGYIYNVTNTTASGYCTLEGLLTTKFGLPKLEAIREADALESIHNGQP